MWTVTGVLATARVEHPATLLPDGKVLIAGGYTGSSNLSSAELYDVGLGFSASWQPQITTFTSPLSAGGSLTMTGSRFRGISGASGGNSQDSPSDYPVVQLRSVESGQILFLRPTNWSSTSYTSAAVNGLPPGWTLATMFVNGIPSTASLLNIVGTKAAATVTLGNLSQTYDGTAKAVTAITTPAGLQVTLTYDGNTLPPTAAGGYAVVATVSDANYAGSATGTLTVNPALSTTSAVASKTLTAGTAAVAFTPVTAAGGTVPYAYAVSPALPAGLTLSTTTGAITGTPATAAAATNYTVTVSDSASATSSKVFSLTIEATLVAPTITTPPASQVVTAGQTATFTVVASGSGLTYQWKNNGKVIPTVTGATLSLVGVTYSDGGYYEVAVTNGGGTVKSVFFVNVAVSNAQVVAWGQIYNGSALVGVTVPPNVNAPIAVAAGNYPVVIVQGDGTVVTWGYNGYGQMNVPAGLNNVTAVAVGTYHTVALKNDGTVVAWGSNATGQTTIPAGLGKVTAIAAGDMFTMALQSDGMVAAWGFNNAGQTNVPADLNNVTAIAAGDEYALALKSDGTVVSWGHNDFGQTSVPAGLGNVTAIAAGQYHALALQGTGTVVAWGLNNHGQATVPTGLSDVTAIAAGGYTSASLKSDGTVVMWGESGGQTAVPVGLSGVVAIATGGRKTVALVGTASAAVPPAIATQPASQVRTAGQSATFTVAASGTPAPTYQWKKGGVALTNGGNVSGATTATLALSSVTGNDAAIYTVTVSNGVGAAVTSNDAVLTVNRLGQTITFALLPDKPADTAPFTLGATASSGLPVSYTSSNPAVATVNGNTVTVTGLGTTTITASQAGDATYLPATEVSQTLRVNAVASPDISYTTSDGSITITGYSGSGGAVTIPGTINGLPVTSIGIRAFQSKSSLTSLTLPSSVTRIEDWAFSYCDNLASVVLPDSVTSIGNYAFAFGNNRTSVTLGSGVTSIGYGAFRYNIGLVSITIPDSVTSIGGAAFSFCPDLTAVTVGPLNTVYGSNAGVLYDKSQTALLQYPARKLESHYTIPAGVVSIGDSAFSSCANLTSVTLPDSLTSIAWSAFNACAKLASVTIPASVTSIEGYLFFGCSSLNNVTIGSGVTSIGTYAFSGCTSLASVVIPAGVTSIGTSAFRENTSLSGIYFQGNAPGLGTDVFYNATHATVYYLPGTTGWAATLGGRPTAMLMAPGITTQPVSQTVTAGGSVTFTVVATGTPAPSYQWKKGGVALTNGGNVSGATTATLALSNVTSGDAALYTVTVSNGVGTAVTSNPAVLTVNPALSSNVAVASKTLTAGTAAVAFTPVTAAGGTVPYAYAVSPALPAGLTLSATTGVITGTPATAAAATNYTVTVSDSASATSSKVFSLTIEATLVAPTITTPPASQVVTAGQTATFTVAATGSGLTYQWKHNGKAMPTATGATLSLVGVTYSAGGYYEVAVTNGNGTAKSVFFVNVAGSNAQVVAWGDNRPGQTNVPAGLSDAVAVAGGGWHSLALRSNGTVVGWGDNNDGQTSVPANLREVVTVAAARAHSLALKADGTVVAWGNNSYGQITVPANLSGVVAVATGYYHSLALKADGTVVAWGANSDGQSTVPANLSGVVAVAAGWYHSLALKADGTVVGWGNSFYYRQLTTPVSVTGVVAVAAGYSHSLVLKADGTVVGGGLNDRGQSTAPSNLTGVVAIVAGDSHSLALKADGTVAAWGFNDYGQITVPANLSGVVAVSAGTSHSLALVYPSVSVPPTITTAPASQVVAAGQTATFTVAATGSGLTYQWKHNGKVIPTVTGATLSLVGVSYSAVGYYEIAVTNGGGTVKAVFFVNVAVSSPAVVEWGQNTYGQTNVPAGLSGPIAVSAGAYFSLSLQADGAVVAWGDNGAGQSTVPAGLSGVVAVAAGYFHSLALKADGTVVAWGYNNYGQSTVPAGLSGVVAVAAGRFHSLGLKADGTVLAWGANTYGQSTVPANLSGVVAVAAGREYSLALKADGTVVAWGDNSFGQITVPSSLSGVAAVIAGSYHSLALKADGTVVAWGNDSYGQITVPSNLSGVVAVAAGYGHSLALKADGTVVGWGYNVNGEINIPANVSGAVTVAAGACNLNSLVLMEQPTTMIAITTQPQSQTVTVGTTATFTVVATGTPAPTYQWRKGTSTLIDGSPISGATTATLTITNAQLTDAGSYTVVVTNSSGSVTSQPALLGVDPTGSVVLTDDFSTPANWSTTPFSGGNGSNAIINGRLEYVVPAGSGNDMSGRVLTIANPSYTGDWSVQVDVHLSSLALSGAQYANLNLIAIKTGDLGGAFETSNNMCVAIDRYSNGGTTVRGFECYVNSYYGGVRHPLQSAETLSSSTDGALRISFNSATKELTASFAADGAVGGYSWAALQTVNIGTGTYGWGMAAGDTFSIMLVGSSGNETGVGPTFASGQAHFDNFRLVTTASIISVQPQSQTAAVGGSATFSVVASGPPPLTYQWRKDGAAISGATHATLTVGNVQLGDAGYYRVVVGSGTGSATSWGAALNLPSVPIATTAGAELGGGAAFDGTNFLVGIQGDATTHDAITAQRVSPTGALVGSRIAVGRFGGMPWVAFGGTNYLMVWEEVMNTVRRLNGVFVSTSGALVGSPFTFPVRAGASARQAPDGIAFDGENFLVVYTDDHASGSPDLGNDYYNSANLCGRFVTPAGAVGEELLLATNANGSIQSVAWNGSTYLVAWPAHNGSAQNIVQGRFVSKSGVMSNVITLTATTSPDQNPLSVATDGTNFLVVWNQSTGAGYPADPIWTLRGRVVTPAGGFLGSEFIITGPEGNPMFPGLAYDGANYLMTWTQSHGPGNTDVAGRYLSPVGALVGSTFSLAAGVGNQGLSPVVAGGGKCLVAWIDGFTFGSADISGGDVRGLLLASTAGPSSAPVITTQPQSQTVAAGASATFAVVASGTPLPTYQWRKNGANLVGATGASYSIASAQSGDTGSYDVVVTNPVTSVTSTAATLTVTSAFGIESYSLMKMQRMTQSSASAPIPVSATPFSFEARVLGPSIDGLPVPTFVSPATSGVTGGSLAYVASKNRWNYSSPVTYASLAAVNPDFRDGTYTMTVNAIPANLVIAGTTPLPASPQISGGTWSGGALQVNVGSDCVLTFLPFSDHAGYNVIDFRIIIPGIGAFRRTTLDPSTVSILIPAGTLTAGTTYAAQLEFLNLTTWDTTTVAGATGASGVGTRLDFSLAGTNAPPPAPAITSPSTATATVGAVFVYTITANNSPTSFAITGNLPAGLSFIATTGVISGTPTAAGTFPLFLTASNAGGDSPPLTLTLAVNALPPVPAITSPSTAAATVGAVFVYTITANPIASAFGLAGSLPAGLTFSSSSGVISGTPTAPGSYPVSLTADNATGTSPAFPLIITVSAAAVGPTITTQPQSRTVAVGDLSTFTVAATGTPLLNYQWRKDGTALGGATLSSYTLASVQIGDAGTYTVVVSNATGSVTSNSAMLSVSPVGNSATHSVAGSGYSAGGTVTVSNTITYTGTATELGWHVLLPSGWNFASDGGSSGSTKPAVGATDLLEWAWTPIGPSPVTFTYTLNVPASQTGDQQLAALAIVRLTGASAAYQLLAQPDPLVVPPVTSHDADSDRNFRISLLELTRVIELYNTRNGTTRTGCYKVETGTEDGFASEPTRASSATVTLTRNHSADSDHNGKLSLLELTRVIELYNTRSGTIRTGAYHVQAGTEDGYAPGP